MINSKITFNDFQQQRFFSSFFSVACECITIHLRVVLFSIFFYFFFFFVYILISSGGWMDGWKEGKQQQQKKSLRGRNFSKLYIHFYLSARSAEGEKHNNNHLLSLWALRTVQCQWVLLKVFEKRAISAGYHKKSWIARDARFLKGFFLFF